MKPWFRSDHPERLLALAAEAVRWQGTPFFPNSSTPGPKGGVSCQKLVAELYRATGLVLEAPDVAMSHAWFNSSSIAEAFIDQLPQFQRFVVPAEEAVKPGDLLGFRLGRITHHLGVCIWPGVFLHAMEHLGTCQSALADPTWGKRISSLWRPLEL